MPVPEASDGIPKHLPESSIHLLKQVFRSLPALNYPANVDVVRQGEPVNFVFLVVSGVVKLSCIEERGKELIIGLRRKGWLLGATSLILEQPYPTTIATLSECELAPIAKAEFTKALSTHWEVSRYVHALHAQEIHDHLEKLVELASRRSEFRLAKLLYNLAFGSQPSHPTNAESVQIPLKQWEIAQLLTITPEHTSRVLRRMEQEGLIKHHRKSIIIANPKLLLAFLER